MIQGLGFNLFQGLGIRVQDLNSLRGASIGGCMGK